MQRLDDSEGREGILHRCTECGAELPGDSGPQLCPRCLLRLGLSEPGAELDVGDQIDHYRILDILGAGGMGLVYVAQDLKLKRKVALKVLAETTAGDLAALKRFRREAQSLAALHHPNVVTVFAVEESEGHHYIVMELVDGVTLERVVTPTGLQKERFLELACELCAAVGAAHERGVVHRDLKPNNVMLTHDGEVKVLDFGLAKFWQPTAEQISTGAATEEGLVVGTVPYMSPEQLQGAALDARTDVFSLGVVLYEMATGRHPFECGTPAETISAILRDEPAPLGEIQEGLTAELQTIIGRCLEKEPEGRYSSAVELAADLNRLRGRAAHEPGNWSAPKWTRLLEWNRLWPWAVAALFIGVIGTVLLQPFAGRQGSEPVVEVKVEDPATPRAAPLAEPEGQSLPEIDADPGGGADPEAGGPSGDELEEAAAEIAGVPTRPVAEPVTEPAAAEYSVQAALFLQTGAGARRVASGSRVAPGDELFLTIESSEDLHVYILNEDDLGEVSVLFPVRGVDLGNPLAAGLRHRLPGKRVGEPMNWQVSSAGGEEHILIVASTEPVVELESLFAGLPEVSPETVEYLQVPESVVASLRGIGRLVEADSAEAPAPGGLLFAEAARVADRPEAARGLWIRRIDLRNPIRGNQ